MPISNSYLTVDNHSPMPFFHGAHSPYEGVHHPPSAEDLLTILITILHQIGKIYNLEFEGWLVSIHWTTCRHSFLIDNSTTIILRKDWQTLCNVVGQGYGPTRRGEKSK